MIILLHKFTVHIKVTREQARDEDICSVAWMFRRDSRWFIPAAAVPCTMCQ